jgi:hypothetical protein
MRLAERFGGGLWRSIVETRADSPIMRAIASTRHDPAVRRMSIVSARDGLLAPSESAWRGARNVVLRGEGAPDHLHTLVDPHAYALLRSNILGS